MYYQVESAVDTVYYADAGADAADAADAVDAVADAVADAEALVDAEVPLRWKRDAGKNLGD